MLKQAVKTAFHVLGFDIRRTPAYRDGAWSNPPSTLKHSRILPDATYSPWKSDPAFLAIYEQVRNHTLVDVYRCHELWALAKQTADIDGDILEVGVWRGGTGAILAAAVKDVPSKTVFLADTFAGVVKAGERDTRYKGGEHADTSLAVVETLIRNAGLANVCLLQGVFPEDTAHKAPPKLSLLHSDVDVYQSSKDIVEWALPRLTTGGFLVFDDYGFSGCEGVTTCCEELRSNPGFRFIYNLNGHAIFLKIR